MPTCLVPALITFYIQGVLKLKKNNSGAKGLICIGKHIDKTGITFSDLKYRLKSETLKYLPKRNLFPMTAVQENRSHVLLFRHSRVVWLILIIFRI